MLDLLYRIKKKFPRPLTVPIDREKSNRFILLFNNKKKQILNSRNYILARDPTYLTPEIMLRPSGHRLKQQTKLSGINMYLDPDLGLKINFTIHSKHKTENKFIYAHKIEEKNEN